jgi:thiol-disulfide isomerase/thioredoxin
MKLSKAIIFPFLLLYCISSYSQYTVLRYSRVHLAGHRDTLDIPLYTPVMSLTGIHNFDHWITGVSRHGDTTITSIKYAVSGPTTALLGDGWGHEIVISPFDTIDVFCQSYPRGQNFLKDSTPSAWTSKMNFSGKHSGDYMLFDSLAYVKEAVHADHLNYYEKLNPDSFIRDVNVQYAERIAYLTRFSRLHEVSAVATDLAHTEIKYAYLSKLLEVLPFAGQEASQAIVDAVKGINADDEYLFKHSILYPWFSELYKINFTGNDTRRIAVKRNLLSDYASFAQTSNVFIRDYLLTELLKQYARDRNDDYDSLLANYNSICADAGYVHYTDSLVNSIHSVSITAALGTKLISDKNEDTILSALLGKYPVVIDCWASWCRPCLQERGAFEAMADQYRGRISFISLSLDKQKALWLKKEAEITKPAIQEYLVQGSFTSDFAAFFKVYSIPRYIFIDRKGNVRMVEAPRPSDGLEFRKQLDQLIAE